MCSDISYGRALELATCAIAREPLELAQQNRLYGGEAATGGWVYYRVKFSAGAKNVYIYPLVARWCTQKEAAPADAVGVEK